MNTNVADSAVQFEERVAAVQAYVLHHVSDSQSLKVPYLSAQLPPFMSLHGLMVVLAVLILIVVCGRRRRPDDAVPTGFANALEFFVVFIRDRVAVPYLGPEDGRRMTPLFCSFFSFILAMNLIGLVPCGFTATANLSVTAALAIVSLGFMIVGAMARNGVVGFFRGFVPHGVPWPVLVVLVPIEIFGLFVKAFALSVRLFANELAGHIVLLFVLGLIPLFGWVAAPFFGMGVLIYILELGVAFLQAYIFTLLSAIFIGQRYHPEH